MTQPTTLQYLMERAKADGSQDPEFFHALLEATVYVHVPRFRQLHPWRFMQFRHPDTGIPMVPFFTDEKRARRAAQSVARVKTMTGRAFMEATRGATLILDPENTPCCILYPEEISALLDEGYMACVQQVKIDDAGTSFCDVPEIPPGLIELVVTVLRELPYVHVAYIAGLDWNDRSGPTTPLIALVCYPKFAERAARAVTTVLQRQADRFHTVVDLTHFDDSKTPPEWIAALELKPVYRSDADSISRGSTKKASKN